MGYPSLGKFSKVNVRSAVVPLSRNTCSPASSALEGEEGAEGAEGAVAVFPLLFFPSCLAACGGAVSTDRRTLVVSGLSLISAGVVMG